MVDMVDAPEKTPEPPLDGAESSEVVGGSSEAPGASPPPADDFAALLAEIDALGGAPEGAQAAPAPSGGVDLGAVEQMFQRIREQGEQPEKSDSDLMRERMAGLEQKLQQMSQEREAMRVRSVQEQINSTIAEQVATEIRSAGFESGTSVGDAYGRVLRHLGQVTWAKLSADQGSEEVDAASIRHGISHWAKLIDRMVAERHVQKQVEERKASRGAPASRMAQSKHPSDMSQDEFNEGVMAELRAALGG